MLLFMKWMTAFHCDPEGVAEAYVMNLMPTKRRALYRSHLKRCAACRREVEVARDYAKAMLAASYQSIRLTLAMQSVPRLSNRHSGILSEPNVHRTIA